ncbi:hypothetical protein QOZ80_6AG0506710 [Eleusine coracana subsp. coracana]|nr:hypothetical protein QOZ80_6AG0506710 [Eleusine coracana subsp. coracana]
MSAPTYCDVRLFMSSVLSLFLPVMSYLFSEAKKWTGMTGLSLRAGLILAWMLLVELLRKKVDEIHIQDYSGIIQRGARIILQHDEGPHQHHLGGAHDEGGDELLKKCKYIVMGEENFVGEPTADGYEVKNIITPDDIVTVGEVWELAEKDKEVFTSVDKNQQLKRLCLSFALFKLLRRRFERLPVMSNNNRETHDCRNLILKGLYNNGESETTAEALFQVMSDEVTFLSEYYHSVVPVVLASPFFLFVNYFFVPIVVLMLCLMTITICSAGDVTSSFNSIFNRNIESVFIQVVICLVSRAPYSPAAFFSIVDLSITALLLIIFLYEEIWEFLAFLLSNWFTVSLNCNYIAKPYYTHRRSHAFTGAVRGVLWLWSKMRHTELRFKQFSVLSLSWPPKLPLLVLNNAALVPNNSKRSIIEYLVEHDTPLTIGVSALQRNNLSDQLSWACYSGDSVAEVILTWHIATSIVEVKCAPRSKEQAAAAASSMVVAIRLSKYCAYLVAFHPELLPDDNREKAELVLEDHQEGTQGRTWMLGLLLVFTSCTC